MKRITDKEDVHEEMSMVRVTWVDSCFDSGWLSMDSLHDRADLKRGMEVESCGFLVGESEDTLTISASVSVTNFILRHRVWCLGAVTIPKDSIKTIKPVRVTV